MKFLKTFFIGLGLLIVILILVAFLLPRKVHVEESIEVNAKPEIVYDQINIIKNWSGWSPWFKYDPDMVIQYEGPESGSGAGYSWKSEEMGDGRLTIASAVPGESIKAILEFLDHGSTSDAEYTFTKTANGTTVVWSMTSDLGFNPIARWMGVFMEKYLREDFKKGLLAIREISEKLEASSSVFNVSVEKEPAFTAITITDTSDVHTFESRLGQILPQIYMALEMNGIAVAGPAFTVYHKWSEDTVILEAGVPVIPGNQSAISFPMKVVEFPETTVASYIHTGSFNTEPSHYAIMDWIDKNGFAYSGAPVEVNLTDPSAVKDTSKWETRIYYPVVKN